MNKLEQQLQAARATLSAHRKFKCSCIIDGEIVAQDCIAGDLTDCLEQLNVHIDNFELASNLEVIEVEF